MALPFVSVWTVYKIQTREAKLNAREFIAKGTAAEELSVFSFSKSEFKELQINEFEFVIHGEYYDIVKISEHVDYLTVTAWHDAPESNIRKTYLELRAVFSVPNTETKMLFFQFGHYFQSLFYCEIEELKTIIRLNSSSIGTNYSIPETSPHILSFEHPPQI